MKAEGGKAQAQRRGDAANIGIMRLEFGGGVDRRLDPLIGAAAVSCRLSSGAPESSN